MVEMRPGAQGLQWKRRLLLPGFASRSRTIRPFAPTSRNGVLPFILFPFR